MDYVFLSAFLILRLLQISVQPAGTFYSGRKAKFSFHISVVYNMQMRARLYLNKSPGQTEILRVTSIEVSTGTLMKMCSLQPSML
jgi:hypothetical protein